MPTPDPAPRLFSQQASAYVLPAVLAVCAYLAQTNYTGIKNQLDRIENRQQIDNVTIAELKLRVLHIEQITGNNAAASYPRQPVDLTKQ